MINVASGDLRLVANLGRWRVIKGHPERGEDFAAYSLNEQGWLMGWYLEGHNYRCGLDGSVKCTWPVRRQGQCFWRTRTLSEEDVAEAVEQVEAVMAEARDRFGALWPDGWRLTRTPAQMGQRFRQVWSRVAILPPDQYAAAVLQLSEGCGYNRCRFCTFYKSTPFRVRRAAEFAEHMERVGDFFGAELAQRRGVFLADANAANLSERILSEALAHIDERAQRDPAWEACWRYGASSFLDTFSRAGRSVAQWRRLRELGLGSLYLGVESGSDELLELWGKPTRAQQVRELVECLKEAGYSVGIIVMSGADADFSRCRHIQLTGKLLNGLPLNSQDKIYISEFQPARAWASDDEYFAYRRQVRQRTEELQAELRLAPFSQGPQVSLYDVWQFLYS